MAKAKKVHYGHYTLGRRALCGRLISCDDCLKLNEKEITCDQCWRALG